MFWGSFDDVVGWGSRVRLRAEGELSEEDGEGDQEHREGHGGWVENVF